MLVVLCNQTSTSERLGHVTLTEVYSSLDQTSALYVFFHFVNTSLVYAYRNTTGAAICQGTYGEAKGSKITNTCEFKIFVL